ncbi:hypothetical protein VPH35_082456 [Triticum aestivum]
MAVRRRRSIRTIPATSGLPDLAIELATPRLPATFSSTTVLTTPLSCQGNQTMELRSQTPPLTTTPTTLEEPTTTSRLLTTTSTSLGGSQAGGLCLFRSVS